MKNNRGITLTSIIVYIAIVIVVEAAVIRITTYFKNNMNDVADVSFETEFQKINLYLLEESKIVGNEIEEVEGTKIIFSNGNKYEYKTSEKSIYLNDVIKICENVESCAFNQKIADNGKSVIVMTVQINETTRTVEYVIANTKIEQVINEVDYTWNSIDGNTVE